jgi:Mycothiol maleylpyruvate isomerase N-terminal domain
MAGNHPVVAAAGVAVQLVAEPVVGHRWDEPSILAGYRIGGLAAHLVRAIETIRAYLDADPPDSDVALVDAVGYYAIALGAHDPLGSDFHAAVRSRGERRVEAGHAALVEGAAAALAWLETATLPPDRPVSVLDGIAIALDDYLDSRLVELVVHGDDLAASVGLATPAFAVDAWSVAANMLAGLTLRRHPPAAVALALARPERHPAVGAFDLPRSGPLGEPAAPR